ncbi:MAG: motility-associated protein, partial [Myxococcota bacterium]
MDPSALLALVFGIGFILVGNALEGGHLSTLLQPTAALIVLGGTTCATWLSSTPDELRALRRLLHRVLRPGLADRGRTSADLLRVSAIVRRDGMLAAEAVLPELADDLLRRGLQLLVDGTPPADARAMLELEAEVEEQRARAGARL